MRSREPTVRIVPVYRRNPKEYDANEKCSMGLMDLTVETFGRIRDAIDEPDCGGKAAVLADRGIGNSPSPLRETGNLGMLWLMRVTKAREQAVAGAGARRILRVAVFARFREAGEKRHAVSPLWGKARAC